MPPNVPVAVRSSQPQSVSHCGHSLGMPFIDPRTVLWANICALLGHQPGDKAPSIDTVQRRVGVGRGTVQRIKEQSAATQLDSLITIAAKLGVPVWKLLQPASEVTAPAVASPRALAVAALFDQLSPRDMQAVEALATNLQPEDATPVRAEPSAAPIPSQEHAG